MTLFLVFTISAELSVEVFCDGMPLLSPSIIESEDGEEINIIFNGTKAGSYYILLKADNQLVRGFPSFHSVVASEVDPKQTSFQNLRSQTLIVTSGVPEDLKLQPLDNFGNPIEVQSLSSLTSRISFQLFHIDSADGGRRREITNGENCLAYLSEAKSLCVSIAFASGGEGWYEVTVQLDGMTIKNGEVTVIVLSRNEKAKVDNIVRCRRGRDMFSTDLDYFEADLISTQGQRLEKPKRVFVYLSDKQISVREYFMKIFLKRTFSYRLVPATKLKLVRFFANAPVIRLEDGQQRSCPEISLRDGLLLVAAFHRVLLERMGGSETFEDKKKHFHPRLIAYHQKKSHRHVSYYLRISRHPSVLRSSIVATKSLSDQDWAKLFVIEFEGENGIDQGGLGREWFSLVTKEIFAMDNKLFVNVEEGSPAMMPNPHPPPDVRTKQMFKFAGKLVGKILYENAFGVSYRQHLPVRLAKSFLAQLVGLRVSYGHFADDAPEFYSSKIRLIETKDIDDKDLGLDDLTFSEEVHEPMKQPVVIDLKPRGRSIRVKESDKLEYLDLLAQYRLSDCIRDHVEHFLEGLHIFVPDSLLSMFDENELELLLCGVREYKLSELRKYHTVVNDGISSKLLNWFWLALSHFTPEQFARLLQFTTGSSQLPTGGFAELRPLFQIASHHTRNSLPQAHTCFNMICLSDHGKFKDFEKALLTAITEGSEGFGLA